MVMSERRDESGAVVPNAGEMYFGDDGTVSMVLDDVVDPDYEPSETELKEYAEWLGIDVSTEPMLMWIAREGLKAPLPKEWKPCKTDTGELYYFNFENGASIWDHPLDEHFKSLVTKERAKVAKGEPSIPPRSSASKSGALGKRNKIFKGNSGDEDDSDDTDRKSRKATKSIPLRKGSAGHIDDDVHSKKSTWQDSGSATAELRASGGRLGGERPDVSDILPPSNTNSSPLNQHVLPFSHNVLGGGFPSAGVGIGSSTASTPTRSGNDTPTTSSLFGKKFGPMKKQQEQPKSGGEAAEADLRGKLKAEHDDKVEQIQLTAVERREHLERQLAEEISRTRRQLDQENDRALEDARLGKQRNHQRILRDTKDLLKRQTEQLRSELHRARSTFESESTVVRQRVERRVEERGTAAVVANERRKLDEQNAWRVQQQMNAQASESTVLLQVDEIHDESRRIEKAVRERADKKISALKLELQKAIDVAKEKAEGYADDHFAAQSKKEEEIQIRRTADRAAVMDLCNEQRCRLVSGLAEILIKGDGTIDEVGFAEEIRRKIAIPLQNESETHSAATMYILAETRALTANFNAITADRAVASVTLPSAEKQATQKKKREVKEKSRSERRECCRKKQEEERVSELELEIASLQGFITTQRTQRREQLLLLQADEGAARSTGLARVSQLEQQLRSVNAAKEENFYTETRQMILKQQAAGAFLCGRDSEEAELHSKSLQLRENEIKSTAAAELCEAFAALDTDYQNQCQVLRNKLEELTKVSEAAAAESEKSIRVEETKRQEAYEWLNQQKHAWMAAHINSPATLIKKAKSATQSMIESYSVIDVGSPLSTSVVAASGEAETAAASCHDEYESDDGDVGDVSDGVSLLGIEMQKAVNDAAAAVTAEAT